MMKWKLFCTVDMKTYYEEAKSLHQAKRQLAERLQVPVSCIEVWVD